MVFFKAQETASTTPTLHEIHTAANKDDSMPCWVGYECAEWKRLVPFQPQYPTHIGVRPAHMLVESCERVRWPRA